ncbi:MAG: flagellin [Anaerovoracaceae bacterium]
MRINHNIAALNTYRQLSGNVGSTGKSLEKLSSGLRINKAGDDAAGLAISEKMRAQIRGLDQATRNASDAISLIQTAEGALTETHSILQRMRELAVQSATDTNTEADRKEIQKEVNNLLEEVDRIAKETQFNGQELLNGKYKGRVFHIGANEGQKMEASISSMKAKALGVDGLSSLDKGTKSSVISGAVAIKNAVAPSDPGVVVDGEYGISATVTITAGDAGEAFNGYEVIIKSASDVDAGNETVELADKKLTITLNQSKGYSEADIEELMANFESFEDFEVTFNFTVSMADSGDDPADYEDVPNPTAISGTHLSAGGASRTLALASGVDPNGTDTGVGGMITKEGANEAIQLIDKAIQTVSSERAKLGGVQNRLEHTINNLGATSENLAASESRIRDVDMAKEMMEFTKNNILSQASQAMLAQANMQPQSVLQLLQ